MATDTMKEKLEELRHVNARARVLMRATTIAGTLREVLAKGLPEKTDAVQAVDRILDELLEERQKTLTIDLREPAESEAAPA